MIPLLLITNSTEELDLYVEKYLKSAPDMVHRVFKLYPAEGKSITIEQIRELKQNVHISSTKRLIVLYEFQTAKSEAQNALLKTLEDQTDANQFIIGVSHIGTILSTIISRCHVEILSMGKPVEIDPRLPAAIDALQKRDNDAFLHDDIFQTGSIEDATHLFFQILTLLHKKVIKGDVYAAQLAKHALEISSLLRTNNLNPQLALDNWCLFAKRKAQ